MNKEYEVTGGIVGTPERGDVRIPPEKTVRKDILEGELVIKTEVTPEKVSAIVASAKRNGITDIPAGRLEDRDEGR